MSVWLRPEMGRNLKPLFITCVIRDIIFEILNKFMFNKKKRIFVTDTYFSTQAFENLFLFRGHAKMTSPKNLFFFNLLPPFHSLALIFTTPFLLVTDQKVTKHFQINHLRKCILASISCMFIT